MKLFVSIVSHLDHDIIINLGTVKKFCAYPNIVVVCRDNKPVHKLDVYCEKYGAIYLPNTVEQGFSANNNQNYKACIDLLGMQEDDLFLLLNPDIFLCDKQIEKFITTITNTPPKLATVNLYLDREYMVQDDNIRIYPNFSNFIKTYLLNDRSTMVNRKKGLTVTDKHWASCSFLVVNAALYSKLNGLDESYYLYCEDIDFCYRARLCGERFTYLEPIKAVHYRRRDSKRFLSKYFFWHVGSVFRYSFLKKKKQARHSCLQHK